MSKGTDFWKNTCHCITCLKFREQCSGAWWHNTYEKGQCDYCKRLDTILCPFIPNVIQAFLKIQTLCTFCRNSISCTVQKRFRLCFAQSSDEAIEVAICAMIRVAFGSEIFLMERPDFFTNYTKYTTWRNNK